MPTLLSDLINAIPVVRRGDVISPESHNSLRDAIVAIVTELGGTVESRNVTLTFAPAFVATARGDEKPWIVEMGYATSPQGITSGIVGWLPLQLPDGSQIQQLRAVFGGKGRSYEHRITEAGHPSGKSLGKSWRNCQWTVCDSVSARPSLKMKGVPSRIPADAVNNEKYKYFVRAHLQRRESRTTSEHLRD